MSKTIRLWLLAAGAGVLAVSGMSAPAATPAREGSSSTRAITRPEDLFAGNLVAKGKGVAIERTLLDETMVGIKAEAAASGQPIPPGQLLQLERTVLQRLIQIRLLASLATDADKAAGQSLSAQRYENIVNRAGGEESLKRKLLAAGTTPEILRQKMVEECIAEAALEREMGVAISDEQVKKFYDDNPSKFEVPERVRVAHVLLVTREMNGQELPQEKQAAKRKQAEELVKRARDGEDFTSLVRNYSEDLGSKDRGGEYVFARASADARRAAPTEFEAAAFSLGTNQISDVVTTQYGYHVIKLLEKIPPQKIEFAKVQTELKYSLAQEALKAKQQQAFDFLDKLQRDAGVEILDERLKPNPADRAPATLAPVNPSASAGK